MRRLWVRVPYGMPSISLTTGETKNMFRNLNKYVSAFRKSKPKTQNTQSKSREYILSCVHELYEDTHSGEVYKMHISDDTTMEQLDFDSLDQVELLMMVEDKLDVDHSDYDFEPKTIGEIVTRTDNQLKEV